MAGVSEKKILEAREHLREAEKWYNIRFMSCCNALVMTV